MKSRTSFLGSARASRAGDGALAIANFFVKINAGFDSRRIDCGEAPQSARGARALPRKLRDILRLFLVLGVAAFAACETSNYVPPVKSTAKNTSRLERGRTLFAHRCIECHTLPPMWKYSREDWPQIVNDMSHRSNLKPEERDAVIAYILAVRATER